MSLATVQGPRVHQSVKLKQLRAAGSRSSRVHIRSDARRSCTPRVTGTFYLHVKRLRPEALDSYLTFAEADFIYNALYVK